MYKIYKVSIGDTLASIANKFNTTIDNLQNINGKDYISMGELIIVPNNNSNDYFDSYTIEKGDSLYSISKKYKISLIDLLNINGLDKDNYIYPGQEILVPKKDINMIITKERETLNSASERLGMDDKELLLQNDNIYLMPEQLLINRN